MQEVAISSGVPPVVRRLEGTFRYELTFEGTRDAKVCDRHTRGPITLPSTLAAQLWHQLGEQLEDWETEAGAKTE